LSVCVQRINRIFATSGWV